MHFIASTLISASLLFASAYAGDGYIRFCNDANLQTGDCPAWTSNPDPNSIDPKTGGKTCIDASDVSWEQCVVIPDFNAKGDIDSCGEAVFSDGHVNGCTFYEDVGCTGRQASYDYHWAFAPGTADDNPSTTIYRSVKCHKSLYVE